MKIHGYQAKAPRREFGVQVPNGDHVIRDHVELKTQFSGPRFFIKIAGLDMHPLDTVDRTTFVGTHAGVGLCNITKCCSEVYPEHIHITTTASSR